MQLKGNIIILVRKRVDGVQGGTRRERRGGWGGWRGVEGAGGRLQRDRGRRIKKRNKKKKQSGGKKGGRGWGRKGREEVDDRAHFSTVLSNGTSSISPKRSLQSTKLLISNERPWNTVAKQLGGEGGWTRGVVVVGGYWAADSCCSVSVITISPHLIDFYTGEQQQPMPSERALENGVFRKGSVNAVGWWVGGEGYRGVGWVGRGEEGCMEESKDL